MSSTLEITVALFSTFFSSKLEWIWPASPGCQKSAVYPCPSILNPRILTPEVQSDRTKSCFFPKKLSVWDLILWLTPKPSGRFFGAAFFSGSFALFYCVSSNHKVGGSSDQLLLLSVRRYIKDEWEAWIWNGTPFEFSVWTLSLMLVWGQMHIQCTSLFCPILLN